MSGNSKKYTVDGLVIRDDAYGENDRLVSILTAERGRIAVIAKGARSMKSKIRGAIQPYTFGNFEISEKGSMGWISSASVIEMFPSLRESMLPISLASYACAVAYELSDTDADATPLLRLMLNTFYLIAYRLDPNDENEFVRVKAAFELCAMAVSGYAPDLSGCIECGDADTQAVFLDVEGGTYLCGNCMKRRAASTPTRTDRYPGAEEGATPLLAVPPDAFAAMRYVLSAPLKRVYAFTVSDVDALEAFAKTAEAYLEYHLERTFASLAFFRTVRADPVAKAAVQPAPKPETD
ncbi:MAG: DNA repair protein RecO [Clostridia bacterium]|nr:DNA repair protein RecO [Clostridia bacterium]